MPAVGFVSGDCGDVMGCGIWGWLACTDIGVG